MNTMPLRALRDTTDPYNLYNHTPRNQPWEDTAMPMDQSRARVSPASDVHWRATLRHTPDSIASRQRRIRVSTPRRSTPPDIWGIVALACGAVTVASVVAMGLMAVGRR